MATTFLRSFFRRLLGRRSTFALALGVLGIVLAGCQGGNILDLGSPSVIVSVRLVGPEFNYPLQNAVVTVNGERLVTDRGGRVNFRGLTDGREYTATVKTEFAEVTETARVSANTVWTVPISLPEIIDDDHFKNIVFWEGVDNRRWAWGDTVTVFFDYSRGQNMPPEERAAAEAQALAEFAGWFQDADPRDPFLIWGGRASKEEDGRIVVHMMHDDGFFEQFPEDKPSEGGFSPVGGMGIFGGVINDVATRGELWFRVDCCAHQQGLYAHEFGHALGFHHPAGGFSGRSVMSPLVSVEGVTPVDRALMQVKMHLPAGIDYNPSARRMMSPSELDPLPMDSLANISRCRENPGEGDRLSCE